MRTIQFQMNARKHAHKNCTWKKHFLVKFVFSQKLLKCVDMDLFSASLQQLWRKVSNETVKSNRNFDGFTREEILLLTKRKNVKDSQAKHVIM